MDWRWLLTAGPPVVLLLVVVWAIALIEQWIYGRGFKAGYKEGRSQGRL